MLIVQCLFEALFSKITIETAMIVRVLDPIPLDFDPYQFYTIKCFQKLVGSLKGPLFIFLSFNTCLVATRCFTWSRLKAKSFRLVGPDPFCKIGLIL